MEEQARTTVLDRVKEIITKDEGVIVKIDEWGKRRLAYEIADALDGFYFVFYFEANSKTLDEVMRVLKITDVALRTMPIRHEKPFGFKQPVAPPAAAAPAFAPAPAATAAEQA